MKYLITAILFVLTLTSCMEKKNLQAIAEAQMMQADREFSALSAKIGEVRAFKRYMAPNGLKLPLEGRPMSYEDYMRMEELPTTSNTETLTWEPEFAVASEAGDMGYTHGTYLYEFYDNNGNIQQHTGYYVTIWKKIGTEWKFVYDAGNKAQVTK